MYQSEIELTTVHSEFETALKMLSKNEKTYGYWTLRICE